MEDHFAAQVQLWYAQFVLLLVPVTDRDLDDEPVTFIQARS